HSSIARGKDPPMERVLPGTEECVLIVVSDHVDWPFSASYRFDRKVDNGGIGVSLTGQNRRLHLVVVVTGIPCNQKRYRNRNHFGRSDWSVKHIVDVIQLSLMFSEVGHHLGIGGDQDGGDAGDCKRRNQMFPLGQWRGKQP